MADTGYWLPADIVANSDVDYVIPLPPATAKAIGKTTPEEVEQLFQEVKEKKKTQAEVARQLGIERETFGRWLRNYEREPQTTLAPFVMNEKFKEPNVKSLFAKRKVMIEPIFGQIKFNSGLDRMQRRGLANAKCDWTLICMAHNIKKIWNQMNNPLMTALA